MKPGGPWNLRGLRPEARAAAREAARRSGMSVGEWLNDVIAPVDEDGEDEWFGHADRGPDDRWKQRSRYGAHQHERYAEPSSSWRRRESFADDDEREHYRRRAPPRRYRDHEPDEWRHSFRDDEERGRYRDPPRRRQRDPEGPYRSAFRDDDGDAELYRDPPPSRRPRHRSENHDNSEAPAREGRPYRLRPDQGVPARAGQKHVDPQESKERRSADADRFERVAEVAAAEERRDASIDKAVAEIAARQRALDGGGIPAPEPELQLLPSSKCRRRLRFRRHLHRHVQRRRLPRLANRREFTTRGASIRRAKRPLTQPSVSPVSKIGCARSRRGSKA